MLKLLREFINQTGFAVCRHGAARTSLICFSYFNGWLLYVYPLLKKHIDNLSFITQKVGYSDFDIFQEIQYASCDFGLKS
jgi:hypothetical protein